jgi:hypothetical protein
MDLFQNRHDAPRQALVRLKGEAGYAGPRGRARLGRLSVSSAAGGLSITLNARCTASRNAPA